MGERVAESDESDYGEIHYDINFESEVPDEKHGALSGALFKSLKDSQEMKGVTLNYVEGKHKIEGEHPTFSIGIWVGIKTHFNVNFLSEPSVNLIETINRISNKVVAYTTNISEIRVKDTDSEVELELPISTNLLPRFFSTEAFNELSSKIKTSTTPFALSFLANLEDTNFLISILYSPRSGSAIAISFHEKSKDIPWDIVTKTNEKTNKVTTAIIQALGVQVVKKEPNH